MSRYVVNLSGNVGWTSASIEVEASTPEGARIAALRAVDNGEVTFSSEYVSSAEVDTISEPHDYCSLCRECITCGLRQCTGTTNGEHVK